MQKITRPRSAPIVCHFAHGVDLAPARRVVNVDQQRAARAAVLEPGMVAPVDLDVFAKTGAPRARRVAAPGPLRPGHPEARRTHPAPQRLDGQDEGVLLGEFQFLKERARMTCRLLAFPATGGGPARRRAIHAA